MFASQQLYSYIGSPGSSNQMNTDQKRCLNKEDLSTSPTKNNASLKKMVNKQYLSESALASNASSILEKIHHILYDIRAQLDPEQNICSQLKSEQAKNSNMLKFIDGVNHETAKVSDQIRAEIKNQHQRWALQYKKLQD